MEQPPHGLFGFVNRLHKLLRPLGLGNFKIFRRIRNFIYRLVSPATVVIEVRNVKMLVDPSCSSMVPMLLRDGVHEEYETELICRSLREGSVFVDVGGNIGYYTVIAASIVKDSGRVITFEPEPRNYWFLARSVDLNGFRNVTLVPMALSHRTGREKLFLSRDNIGAHHLSGFGDESESISIDTTTLDDYVFRNPTKIDIIKMDIEGFEPFALAGMRNQISLNPQLKIFTEYFPSLIRKAGAVPEQFLKELESLGFILYLIQEWNGAINRASIETISRVCEKRELINLYCERSTG